MKFQSYCLTQNFRHNARCDKCDLPLEKMTWKNKKIALSTGKNKSYGFICVRCILRGKNNQRIKFTPEQLDEFFRKKLKEIIVK